MWGIRNIGYSTEEKKANGPWNGGPERRVGFWVWGGTVKESNHEFHILMTRIQIQGAKLTFAKGLKGFGSTVLREYPISPLPMLTDTEKWLEETPLLISQCQVKQGANSTPRFLEKQFL